MTRADNSTPPRLVTRFAPSPNGPLHLGHALSAIVGHDLARDAGGEFLLRIEDIDGPRSRPEFAESAREDLAWLGLSWREVPAQSTRLADYKAAADRLQAEGMAYECHYTRAEIAALPRRKGADGLEYPGSPRGLGGQREGPAAVRLDIDAAMARVGEIVWTTSAGDAILADPREFGDPVLIRKELPASYHLAATIDDASDGITMVTRGEDLLTSTHIHRILQALLDLPVPSYHHHALLLAGNGEKLSKSRDAPALADRRKAGEDGRALADRLRERHSIAGT